MPLSKNQENKMKWVLFWVFIGFFVVILTGTLWAVFIGNENVTAREREILFYAFIVEIGAAVFALFYSIFALKAKSAYHTGRLRLSLGEHDDMQKLIGKRAILEPLTLNNESLGELDCQIMDDLGPFLTFNLPPSTNSVYLTIHADDKTSNGSFVVGNYTVDLIKE